MANSLFSRGAFLSGSKTVTAAGTAEALASAALFRSLLVIAKDNNTGRVYLGGSTVASTTNRGLAPGDSVELGTKGHEIDLAQVFIDVDTSAEGVDFYAGR
jgi:hypothetical protein